MNDTDHLSYGSKNCGGRCVVEMEKRLDSEVITEFFEVVRDFYNDDKTSTQLKELVISKTNEAVELLNEKSAELCSFIDEIFLNRRHRQTLFYRLCHKLARKGTPEGSHLPDESKCVCFSEENLKRFNIDPAADPNIKLISNFEAFKDGIAQIYAELQCTKCRRLSQTCRYKCLLNADFICDCSVPSVSSQHKVYEAILDFSENKDPKIGTNSLYLTHLKRDAEYYRKRATKSPMPSDESVDSFEVISPENANLENDLDTDYENLKNLKETTDIKVQPLHQIGTDFKKLVTAYDAAGRDKLIHSLDSFLSIAESERDNLKMDVNSVFSEATDANSCCRKQPSSLPETNNNDVRKTEIVVNCKKSLNTPCVASAKFSPADIVKQSFSHYFNDVSATKFAFKPAKSSVFLENHKDQPSPVVSELCQSLKNLGVCLRNEDANKTSIESVKTGNPNDILKQAFSSYFSKKSTYEWLRK